jgi:hypothetical protein
MALVLAPTLGKPEEFYGNFDRRIPVKHSLDWAWALRNRLESILCQNWSETRQSRNLPDSVRRLKHDQIAMGQKNNYLNGLIGGEVKEKHGYNHGVTPISFIWGLKNLWL